MIVAAAVARQQNTAGTSSTFKHNLFNVRNAITKARCLNYSCPIGL